LAKTLLAKENEGYTGRFNLKDLAPNTKYSYEILINEKPAKREEPLRFKTQSDWHSSGKPQDFRMVTGSCTYVNDAKVDGDKEPYGSRYGVFKHMANAKPDLMIWLGDNMYLRKPDLDSPAGYIHRYTHTRKIPEMQSLLQTTHHYAIWDDHDFGPNDSDGSWRNKDIALNVFNLFWMNPVSESVDYKSITTKFQYLRSRFFPIG
jgi:alkaline phosphatase D